MDASDFPEWSEDLIKQSQELWSERYGREISRREAEEILTNLTGFFRILLEWEAKEMREQVELEEA